MAQQVSKVTDRMYRSTSHGEGVRVSWHSKSESGESIRKEGTVWKKLRCRKGVLYIAVLPDSAMNYNKTADRIRFNEIPEDFLFVSEKSHSTMESDYILQTLAIIEKNQVRKSNRANLVMARKKKSRAAMEEKLLKVGQRVSWNSKEGQRTGTIYKLGDVNVFVETTMGRFRVRAEACIV